MACPTIPRSLDFTRRCRDGDRQWRSNARPPSRQEREPRSDGADPGNTENGGACQSLVRSQPEQQAPQNQARRCGEAAWPKEQPSPPAWVSRKRRSAQAGKPPDGRSGHDVERPMRTDGNARQRNQGGRQQAANDQGPVAPPLRFCNACREHRCSSSKRADGVPGRKAVVVQGRTDQVEPALLEHGRRSRYASPVLDRNRQQRSGWHGGHHSCPYAGAAEQEQSQDRQKHSGVAQQGDGRPQPRRQGREALVPGKENRLLFGPARCACNAAAVPRHQQSDEHQRDERGSGPHPGSPSRALRRRNLVWIAQYGLLIGRHDVTALCEHLT